MVTTKVLARMPREPERRAAARMTGRYLVTMQKDAHVEVAQRLDGLKLSSAVALAKNARSARPLPSSAYLLLPQVGIGIVDALPEQEDHLFKTAAESGAITALEPERIVRAIGSQDLQPYLQGWRDATEALGSRLVTRMQPAVAAAASDQPATWGLLAAAVTQAPFSGAGVRIAILDTGLDLTHPDFAGREIASMNFVGDNLPFHDGLGHGTHCTGTAAGPTSASQGPRYGVAAQSAIWVGRVLDENGQGGDFNVLQGIDWAISQGCTVISLSLGTPWSKGDPPFSQAYESAARRALAAGCLIVAAAGNEAADPRYIGAVGTPGNSPSVLTVAAVDKSLATAVFSNRAEPAAPEVKAPDIAGPGVDVYSCWPVAMGGYKTISGTSMATPHVAGIAALYAQAHPGVRGQALKDLVLREARALGRAGELGAGLVQAPEH